MPQVSGSIKPDKIRLMRKDPTIFLARLMLRAGIISASWAVESDEAADKERVDYIEMHTAKLKDEFLDDATRGVIDWGWQGFEKLSITENGKYHIQQLKPLLQELTEIVIEKEGAFSYFKQGDISLKPFDSMLVNNDAECGYLYGASYMRNVEAAYDSALRTTTIADVYDKKIAGAHWIIFFPDGRSLFNGQETENQVIAKTLINSLENSGSMAIPFKTLDVLDDLNQQSKSQWTIELKEASGQHGAQFNERLNRTDKEKVRGFGIPERSVLEGQFGTKAEADAHGDFALTGIELLHARLVRQFNQYVTDFLLEQNYGPEAKGTIYVVAQPLSDSSLAFLRTLYSTVVGNPDGFLNEVTTLDLDAIKARLSIPYTDGANEVAVTGQADPADPVANPTDPGAGAVKAVALNGAQVSSLQEIIINAQTMVYPVETAKEICKVAFGLDDATVDKLFAAVVPAKPVGVPAP